MNNWKEVVTLFGCVFIVLNESCESKVGYFTDELMRYQDVCSSQVSVNVIFLLNEGHAVSHLQGTAHHQVCYLCVLKHQMNDCEEPVSVIYCAVLDIWTERFLNQGGNHFPRSAPYTLLPLYSTQVHRCAYAAPAWLPGRRKAAVLTGYVFDSKVTYFCAHWFLQRKLWIRNLVS